jgi:hypothetical protein
LSKRLIATGTKIIVATDQDGSPIWKSLRVNKTTLTPVARLLIAKGPVFDVQTEEEHFKGSDNDKNAGASSHTSTPRQNLPTTKEIVGQPPCKGVEPTSRKGTSSVVDEHQVDTSNSEDVSTRSEAATGAPSKLKHNASKNKRGKPAKQASLFRRKRNRTPRTWDNARRLLLHELTLHARSEPNFETIYQITELQTDRRYPRLCLTAVNWEKWLPSWLDLSWNERRRALKVGILPELIAFCAHLVPPETQKLTSLYVSEEEKTTIKAQLAGYRAIREAMTALPKKIFFLFENREKISGSDSSTESNSISKKDLYVLENLPWLLNTGRLFLKNVRNTEYQIFNDIANAFGVED